MTRLGQAALPGLDKRFVSAMLHPADKANLHPNAIRDAFRLGTFDWCFLLQIGRGILILTIPPQGKSV